MRNYEVCLSTRHIFAACGMKRTGKANLGNMEKISRPWFVPAEKVDNLLLYGKMLNAATIVALYRVLYYHMKRSGK